MPVRYGFDMDHVCFLTEALGRNCHEDTLLSYSKTVNGENRNNWVISMNDKLILLANSKVWTLVKLLQGRKAVKTKWD